MPVVMVVYTWEAGEYKLPGWSALSKTKEGFNISNGAFGTRIADRNHQIP